MGMNVEPIPSFFLYGEPPKPAGDRFLHLESLEERARPSNWTIRPHAHANLNHCLSIEAGSGEMQADGAVFRFSAPCLLIVPAGVVHGFKFAESSDGHVLTLSKIYLHEIHRRHLELRPMFDAPHHIRCSTAGSFSGTFGRLGRELSWRTPGYHAAVEATLVGVLVDMLRLTRQQAEVAAPGPYAQLVARFRGLVEEGRRSGRSVDDYARELSTSPKRLRRACKERAGASPAQIIHDRVVLEAQRLLVYSNMTIGEIAFYLGFDDAAYFSRFFARECGASPRAFRTQSKAE